MRHLFRTAVPGVSALVTGLLYTSHAWAAPGTNGFRILHHEAVQVTSEKGVGTAERMSFNAYGRHFDLNLTPNERIRRGLPTGVSGTMPLAGSVDGLAGSWVRVTRSASGLRGMLFDGRDLYAIEPAAEASAATVQPLRASDGDTVVYRLSDALMPVESMSCEVAKADGTPETPVTAADAFKQLSTELQTFETAEVNVTRQVRVGVVADYEFTTQFQNSTPEDAIVARMNIVDGIFSTQLGVKVALGTPTLFRSATDPFTASSAKSLLDEVRTYRFGSDAQRQYGITHLMTGRDLDTTTVGIAYQGTVCQEQFGASLSQSGLSTTQAALIAAHEIGHNFGAPHDGEGACASSPQTFLMAPQLNGSDQFSSCSISQIQAVISQASCLRAYTPPDARIDVPSQPVMGTAAAALVASFGVTASGDDASTNVNVSVSIPAGVTVNSASVNGGTCQTGANNSVSCAIGMLGGGDSRQVDLNLTPASAGTLTLNATVSSSNDPNSSNDSGAITVNVAASNSAPVTPPPTGGSTSGSGGGGGGGGSLDVSLLSFLGLATLIGLFRRRLRLPAR
jgi:hypothetical protein